MIVNFDNFNSKENHSFQHNNKNQICQNYVLRTEIPPNSNYTHKISTNITDVQNCCAESSQLRSNCMLKIIM